MNFSNNGGHNTTGTTTTTSFDSNNGNNKENILLQTRGQKNDSGSASASSITSNSAFSNPYIYPKPTAYHRPFYGTMAGLTHHHHSYPIQTTLQKQRSDNIHTPLKKNRINMDIDNISQEIYYGLQGQYSFWSVMFGNNIYIFLLIISVIICNINIIYIQWIIPNLCQQRNLCNIKTWQYGMIYIPMQVVLFIFYPLIISLCNYNQSLSQNKIYLLIIGLVLSSLTTGAITIIYNVYLLFVAFAFLGLFSCSKKRKEFIIQT